MFATIRMLYWACVTALALALGALGPILPALAAEPDCGAGWARIGRTLSTEVEVPESSHASTFHLLHQSRFGSLFTLQAKDRAGNWVSHLIPEAVSSDPRFVALLQAHPTIQVRAHQDGRQITNYADLDAGSFKALVTTVLEISGRADPKVFVRKEAAVWAESREPLDDLIPEIAAIEWRAGGKVVNLEFPQVGFTRERGTIFAYLAHVLKRLGIESEETTIDEIVKRQAAHLHWVPDPRALPAAQRSAFYQALIAQWGDLNDASFIDFMTDPFRQISQDDSGLAQLGDVEAALIVEDWLSTIENSSIQDLTRSTYLGVIASESGIRVLDPAEKGGINALVDPNFPAPFKRLPFGLRGKYGQSTVAEGTAVPIVGVEARAAELAENMAIMLPFETEDGAVDIAAMLKRDQNYSRGIEDREAELRARFAQIGRSEKVFDSLTELVNRPYFRRFPWKPEDIRARLLAPLEPWRGHPLVLENLLGLSDADLLAAMQKYESALDNYRKFLAKLEEVLDKPKQKNIQLDWMPLPYRGVEIEEDSEIFIAIFMIEASRFFNDSGLRQLLTYPK